MTALAQGMLFLSSYFPLFVVFALLNTFGAGPPSVVCVALAVMGVLSAAVVFPAVNHQVTPSELNIESTQVRDGDALAYIATYLIPFAAVGATTGRERAAVAVFFVLLAIIYIRSELFYVNPVLAAVGYRLFQTTTPQGASVVLVTKRRFVAANSKVMARRLGAYVYWEAPT
jgi:hypothetical protein